ncbi:MAG TPA: metallophosphoesterase [Candidatus Dormibacteraeota bacterium]|nr:metallophosphoesterase [Candidatus Dormibacteraeota bacterium]
MTRVFYATDLHGSEVCWRKFLNAAKFYRANVLICSGDLTGKAIIPLVEDDGGYEYALSGTQQRVTAAEVDDAMTQIQRRGYYPVRMSSAEVRELEADPARLSRLFTETMCQTVARWLKMADERLATSDVQCFVCPGNDDELAIDDVIRAANRVHHAEGKVIDVDGFEMISTGWSNPTPWKTHREESEEDLGQRIEAMVVHLRNPQRAIFNFHLPPYGTKVDEASAHDENLGPLHGGRAMRPVGSTAVRDAINRHQPMLSLHGHIHESKGATKLGRTLAINPGSAYEEGTLMAAVIELDARKGVKSYQFVNG